MANRITNVKDVVTYYIDKRNEKGARKYWTKISKALKKCYFETDSWDAYKSITPKDQHKVGKNLTYYIEGFNTTVRARVSRLVRKHCPFLKERNGIS